MGNYILTSDGELYHYGVKGMKWGVRRYQNPDGSLTSAGKKRLAKSIREAARDTTKDAQRQLRYDIIDDLSTNYKTQIREQINNVRAKKQTYKELEELESSYWRDGGGHEKDHDRAYNEVLEWFKTNKPETLSAMVKQNGGSEKRLWQFHDFDTMLDGAVDNAYTQGLSELYKKNGLDYTKTSADKAYGQYHDSCREATDSILGRYGRMRIPKNHPSQPDRQVRDIITTALDRADLDKFN